MASIEAVTPDGQQSFSRGESPSAGRHGAFTDRNIPRTQEHSEMADSNRMAEDPQTKLRDTADRVSEMAHEAADHAGETIRKATDRVNDAAKDGLKTARQFAQTAQKYVEESGLADVDVREIVKREPWIALGAAFALGYVAAQIMRRVSRPE
jgi:ElaB/YqjD/DUF883 family membrane-anchored ribosome-binding protein